LTSNYSLPGDLEEPFRWMGGLAVMEAFESGVLDLPDFYFTADDYRYRFDSASLAFSKNGSIRASTAKLVV